MKALARESELHTTAFVKKLRYKELHITRFSSAFYTFIYHTPTSLNVIKCQIARLCLIFHLAGGANQVLQKDPFNGFE